MIGERDFSNPAVLSKLSQKALQADSEWQQIAVEAFLHRPNPLNLLTAETFRTSWDIWGILTPCPQVRFPRRKTSPPSDPTKYRR